METLDQMRDYFQDGKNWTQGMYENASGARNGASRADPYHRGGAGNVAAAPRVPEPLL